ncbi:hypothetical protein HNR23_003473 [Nocardiopsis mwathae]|uniref:Uncharacterized protein n=1 Tax=Nocardiopsis mwathae TaxID=1472723 RepID=A0A7W9YJQ2_9ACTN|nr:hypothetical protein [Nocardiopsis mwathae]MBB6173413.1 hypothetical protein [Nocardiopsis mwathae]
MSAALSSGCDSRILGDGDPEGGPSPNASQKEVDNEWKLRQFRVQALERILDSKSPNENRNFINEVRGDGYVGALMDSGILVELDGKIYEVEVDNEKWNGEFWEGKLPDSGSASDVDQALSDYMDASNISICGADMRGYEAANMYMESHSDDVLSSFAAYREQIDDYLNCEE